MIPVRSDILDKSVKQGPTYDPIDLTRRSVKLIPRPTFLSGVVLLLVLYLLVRSFSSQAGTEAQVSASFFKIKLNIVWIL